jgi:hypothetical protein
MCHFVQLISCVDVEKNYIMDAGRGGEGVIWGEGGMQVFVISIRGVLHNDAGGSLLTLAWNQQHLWVGNAGAPEGLC